MMRSLPPSLAASLRNDRRGVATTEFALLTVFFFFTVLAALDIAGLYIARTQLGTAVAGAANAAFANRDAVSFANLPSFVTQAAQAPAGTPVTVTVGCNGGTNNCTNGSGRACTCLGRDGRYVGASCSAPCSGSNMSAGATAGYYLTIRASYPYRPVLLPHGMLGDATVTQSATVRLQ